MKFAKKAAKRLEARRNAWNASGKMREHPKAFKYPGSKK